MKDVYWKPFISFKLKFYKQQTSKSVKGRYSKKCHEKKKRKNDSTGSAGVRLESIFQPPPALILLNLLLGAPKKKAGGRHKLHQVVSNFF